MVTLKANFNIPLVSFLFFSFGFSVNFGEHNFSLASEVEKHAKTIVKIFSGFPDQGIKIYEDDIYVGSISYDKDTKRENVYINFRGAKGSKESLSCIKVSTGPIRQGFLEAYNNLKGSLFKGMQSYLEEQELKWEDVTCSVAGHSRGSTFVPFAVGDLKNKGAKIKAYTFSPLGVFDDNEVKIYNLNFKNFHINLCAEEDRIDDFLQWGNKIATLGFAPTYKMPGETFRFKAEDYPEFKEWAERNPYIHLDPSLSSLIKNAATPIQWAAHMPEAYAMLVGKVLGSKKTSLSTSS